MQIFFTSLTLSSWSLQRLRRNVDEIRQTTTSETVAGINALGVRMTIVTSGRAFVFKLVTISSRPMDRIRTAILKSSLALASENFFHKTEIGIFWIRIRIRIRVRIRISGVRISMISGIRIFTIRIRFRISRIRDQDVWSLSKESPTCRIRRYQCKSRTDDNRLFRSNIRFLSICKCGLDSPDSNPHAMANIRIGSRCPCQCNGRLCPAAHNRCSGGYRIQE